MTHEQILSNVLEDMRAKMYYNTSKTLFENVEINKPRVMMGEQRAELSVGMPGYSNPVTGSVVPGSDAEWNDAQRAAWDKITDGLSSKYGDMFKNWVVSEVEEIVDNWDHETSFSWELALTFAGIGISLIPGGFIIGGPMVAAGTAIGTMDAMVYFHEGSPYTGTLYLALQLIPGGEAIRLLKGESKLVKEFAKIGKNVDWNSIKEVLKNPTKWPSSVYKELVKSGTKAAKVLSKPMLKTGVALLKAGLKKLTLKQLLMSIVKLSKWGGKTVLKVLGTAISVDLLLYLLSIPSETIRKARETEAMGILMQELYKLPYYGVKSLIKWNPSLMIYEPTREFLAFLERLYGIDGEVNEEQLQLEVLQALDDFDWENPEILKSDFGIQTQESLEADLDNFEKTIAQSIQELGVKVENKSYDPGTNPMQDGITVKPTINANTATIDDVLNNRYEIKPDSAGKIVIELQKMLSKLGYDLGDSGKNKDGIDGIYGSNTLVSVIEFQEENGLKGVDGIVGDKTMKKLIEKTK